MPGYEPTAPPFGEIRLGSATNRALLALGDAVRGTGASGWCVPLYTSGSIDRGVLEEHAGRDVVALLVESNIARASAERLQLAFLVSDVDDLMVATPLVGWGDDVVYTGPDSRVLVDVVRRYGRSGQRAVELGTGSGLVAAAVAQTHDLTIATELFPSVAVAAQITFALNHRPVGHRVVAAVGDVGRGLRPDSCDLVAANTPWLPAGQFDR